jgi:hypothetical protein
VRRKAENKIRQAAAESGQAEFYRIDKVRAKAGLIRKVFDKTILDMGRVGAIELVGGSTADMNPSEIGNLIRDGEKLHVRFRFLDSEGKPEALKIEKPQPEKTAPQAVEPQEVEVVLLELEPAMWQRFEHRCLTKEDKDPLEKIKEMIHDYSFSRRE